VFINCSSIKFLDSRIPSIKGISPFVLWRGGESMSQPLMPKWSMASQSSLRSILVSLVASILHWEQTIRETSKVWRIDPVKPKNGIQTTTNQAQQKGRHIWRGERLLMSEKDDYVVINSFAWFIFFDNVVKRPIERWEEKGSKKKCSFPLKQSQLLKTLYWHIVWAPKE